MSNVHAFILSGGAGKRLWPLSVPERPKQFHRICSNRTLLEETFSRARAIAGDNVWVVTGNDFINLTLELLPDMAEENIIVEPALKNTAASIAWAIAKSRVNENDVIVVLPADHYVEPDEKFIATVNSAVKAALQGWIGILGVTPTGPEIGYGYMLLGEEISEGVFKVEKFQEKPDDREAKALIEKGALWNAGVFVMKVATAVEAFKQCSPEYFEVIEKPEESTFLHNLPSLPFDKAVLERFSRVAAVRASFRWRDLGTWDSIAEFVGTHSKGNVVTLNAPGSSVLSFSSIPVALYGLRDIIVVVADSGVLVLPKGASNVVRELYERIIKQSGGEGDGN